MALFVSWAVGWSKRVQHALNFTVVAKRTDNQYNNYNVMAIGPYIIKLKEVQHYGMSLIKLLINNIKKLS